jgi:hypothetical protein
MDQKQPNLMRGIAVYANPDLELAKRMHAAAQLKKATDKNRVDVVEGLTKVFGRETMRAVLGEDAA